MSAKSQDLPEQVQQGISALKQGGVIAYPTDTVYGLGASPFNEAAIRRIYRIKERSLEKGMPLLLAEESGLDQIAMDIPETARIIIRRFWPGGLTVILTKAPGISELVSAGPTIAVRVPDHPVPRALAKGLGSAIIGTSANISGQPPALTAAEVCVQIGDRLDLIIDGGTVPGGMESTVVDLTVSPPVIRRHGAVPVEKLREICPDIVSNFR